MTQFTTEDNFYTPETESLLFNMWFVGVGTFKKQEDKDLFFKRYLMLSVSQGAPNPFLTKKFVDSAPLGLWTNGGTKTDAAFRKVLTDNLERTATSMINNDKKDA